MRQELVDATSDPIMNPGHTGLVNVSLEPVLKRHRMDRLSKSARILSTEFVKARMHRLRPTKLAIVQHDRCGIPPHDIADRLRVAGVSQLTANPEPISRHPRCMPDLKRLPA